MGVPDPTLYTYLYISTIYLIDYTIQYLVIIVYTFTMKTRRLHGPLKTINSLPPPYLCVFVRPCLKHIVVDGEDSGVGGKPCVDWFGVGPRHLGAGLAVYPGKGASLPSRSTLGEAWHLRI